MKEQQINKSKIILAVAIVMILSGIIFLGASLTTLNKAIKLDTFYSLEPIKTGEAVSNRDIEYEDVFSIVTGELGENINPFFASLDGEKIVSELIFEPLFKADSTGQLKRVLADNIQYLDEEKTIIVTIKDDILFSDGSKLTTEDVENAILFHALQGVKGSQNIVGVKDFLSDPSKKISGVERIDDDKIKITFSKYDIDNDSILEILVPKSAHVEWTFNEDVLDQVATYLGDGIGSNSYQLSEKTGKYITLVENSNYREEIKDVKQVNVYHQSAIDIDDFVDKQILDMGTFHRESGFYNNIYNNENIDMYSREMLGTLSILFNMENEFMKSNIVRQAVTAGINRDELISLNEISRFIPVSSMLSTTGFTSGLHNNSVNTEEATKLLEEAKVELGLEKITLYLPIVKDNEIQTAVAYKLKEQLESVGFGVTVDELSLSNYMDAIYISKRYSIYISEIDALTNTNAVEEYASQFFYTRELPLDLQMEFIVFAKGEEEKVSAYEALDKALKQESSVVPFARIQDFTSVSNYWDNIIILPNKNAPHNLHLVEKK